MGWVVTGEFCLSQRGKRTAGNKRKWIGGNVFSLCLCVYKQMRFRASVLLWVFVCMFLRVEERRAGAVTMCVENYFYDIKMWKVCMSVNPKSNVVGEMCFWFNRTEKKNKVWMFAKNKCLFFRVWCILLNKVLQTQQWSMQRCD